MISNLLINLLFVLFSFISCNNNDNDNNNNNNNNKRYDIKHTMTCCSFIDNSTDLMNCIDNIEPSEKETNSNIAIITYASPGIFQYASYAFAINSAYAENNGYEIFFLTPETGSNYEPRDQRWNRVKILQEALDPSNGWLRDIEYIAWVDADLIFLDLEFSLEKLTKDYPNYDIIISAERHAETGVANTGSFLIKNTPWTIQFLNDWWTNYDRSLNHDQVFFDKLYKSRMPGIQNHVKILPTDEINSTPPPTLYQVESNKVLHLMGQPNELRRKIFHLGFEEICHAYNTNEVIQSQLGLSQPVLFSIGLQYYENQLSTIISNFENKDYITELTAEKYLNEASIARENMLQISLYNPNIDQSDVMQVLYQTVKQKTLEVEKLNPSYGSSDLYYSPKFLQTTEGRFLPSLYNAYAVYGNDIMRYVHDKLQKKALVNEIELNLNKMELVLQKHQLHIPREMKLRLFTSIGHLEFEDKNYAESIPYFQKSVQMLQELKDKANPVYGIDPLMSIGSAYCMIGQTADGINSFIQAIELQEKLLFAEQQLKQDHITLATTFLRLGGCLAKHSNFREAKHVLSRAYDILVNHPEKKSTNPLLEGWDRIDSRVSSELITPEDIEFVRTLERDRLDGKFKTQSYTQKLKLQNKQYEQEIKQQQKQQNIEQKNSESTNNGKVRKLMKKKKKDNKSEL